MHSTYNLYIRIYPYRLYNSLEEDLFLSASWHRPKYKIHTGLSMLLDISKGQEYLLSKLSKNWKRNLNRSAKRNINIKHWASPDINEIYSLNVKLAEAKGINKLSIWPRSKIEIKQILNAFDNKIIMYRCLNNFGETIAFRGCVIFGHFALDLFSAAIGEGRKNYASYALFWELINNCALKGIKKYDLNGIDPVNGVGVYNFKKGTGADTIKYLGGLEWGTSKYLRLFCDYMRYNKLTKL